MAFNFGKISGNLTPILVVVLVAASFAIGALWQKVVYLEKNGVSVVGNSPSGGGAPAAPSSPTVPVKASSLNLAEVTDKDHVRGNKNADLTWIEYSDLQCPFCKKIHPDMLKMLSEYDGKVRLAYRHFPLSSIHPRAQKSAEASECVAASAGNDAFWKFIDYIFAEGSPVDVLEEEGLIKAAKTVGANEASVRTCLTSGQFASKVQNDYDSGSKAGVSGTPGGFLLDKKGNAWVISGALPYAIIKQVVDTALK